MAFSYNRLWKLLIDKGMSKTELRIASGIGTTTLAKMGNNEQVAMDVLNKICNALNCEIQDIIEHVKTDKAAETEQ